MNINILEIAVLVVTVLLIISGFRRGFVRKLASMLSLVLSIALVSAVLPYVTDFIKENTPVYDYIVEQCENVLISQLVGISTGSSGISGSSGNTGTFILSTSSESTSASDYLASLTREEAKALMEQYGYGEYASLVDSLSDEEFEAYKEQYLGEYVSQLFSGNSGSDSSSGESSDLDTGSIASVISSLTLDKSTQNEIIDSLPLPEVIKDMLVNHNNNDGYEALDVSNFQGYIVEYLATLILNVISFIVAVLLVHIVLRLLIMVLDIIAHFPVIGFVNRLAGAGLGIVEALFLLWLFFLILTILQATSAGETMLLMVEESSLLSWLYESNLFLRIVLWAAAMFA
ncbi:MAG: CvpA family protein [Lachnospiraceae bacterium]|nr:CvpA family protein [Lachnospiraceae bacterium]